MEYYILVAGNGNTTRANVEALIDDHFIANGDEGTLVLAFESTPTQGQKWAAQFAKDNNKKTITYSLKEHNTLECPRTSAVISDTPFEEAVKDIAGKNSVGFLLWDDEDMESAEVLRLCKNAGIKCFDLTTGLYEITPADNIEQEVAPIIPLMERLSEAEVLKEEPQEEDEDVEEDEEEVEEVGVEETLTDAVTFIAQIFARELAAEFKKLLDK